jgi:ankyrin repeat protein
VTPHSAACKGQAEATKTLVVLGADMQPKTVGGATPLHEAALNWHAEALVELGADREAKAHRAHDAGVHIVAAAV